MNLIINKIVNTTILRETVEITILMLPDPFDQVTGYTCI